jgi:hypothetical protein
MMQQYQSPACFMHEVNDAQTVPLSGPEIVEFLNFLLEAERAGAAVARKSAQGANPGPLANLLDQVRQDELRWCRMLTKQLQVLGVRPSDSVGAFYEKAMAIADLPDRMRLLNRGQGWVVRKLNEVLPRISEQQLHADLTEMLRAHELNIERLDNLID